MLFNLSITGLVRLPNFGVYVLKSKLVVTPEEPNVKLTPVRLGPALFTVAPKVVISGKPGIVTLPLSALIKPTALL